MQCSGWTHLAEEGKKSCHQRKQSHCHHQDQVVPSISGSDLSESAWTGASIIAQQQIAVISLEFRVFRGRIRHIHDDASGVAKSGNPLAMATKFVGGLPKIPQAVIRRRPSNRFQLNRVYNSSSLFFLQNIFLQSSDSCRKGMQP